MPSPAMMIPRESLLQYSPHDAIEHDKLGRRSNRPDTSWGATSPHFRRRRSFDAGLFDDTQRDKYKRGHCIILLDSDICVAPSRIFP